MPQVANTEKHPDAELTYSFDWSEWLDSGDTIAMSEWSSDSGITLANPQQTNDATSNKFTGGTDGTEYCVQNKITTANGEKEVAYLKIKVEDKCKITNP